MRSIFEKHYMNSLCGQRELKTKPISTKKNNILIPSGPWQTKFVEVTDLSSLSRRFYVRPKFVFISLSLVNQKVITGSSNPFSGLFFIAMIYFRPPPRTCRCTRHARIYLRLNVTHFYKPLKGHGRVLAAVEWRAEYRQNHQSPVIRVLNRAWWMLSTARLPTRRSTFSAASWWDGSIISSRWRSANGCCGPHPDETPRADEPEQKTYPLT